jgi:hypothetical protein
MSPTTISGKQILTWILTVECRRARVVRRPIRGTFGEPLMAFYGQVHSKTSAVSLNPCYYNTVGSKRSKENPEGKQTSGEGWVSRYDATAMLTMRPCTALPSVCNKRTSPEIG